MMKSLTCSLIAAFVALPAIASAQDVQAGKEKAAQCAACHGEDGNSPSGAFPILAGQTQRYIYLQLKDYKEGRRKNPLMSPMAANLSKKDMQDLAAYFAAQKPKPTGFKGDPDKIVRGKQVAADALCPMCHLGGFSGQNEVPRVAGQHQEYIYAQLLAFKNKERTNDAGNMASVVKTIPDADLEAMSHYIANLN
jgi:cytochrome c553